MVDFVPRVTPPTGTGPGGRWLLVRDGDVLITAGLEPPVVEDPATELGLAPESERLFLGLRDGQPCWAAGVEAGTPEPDGTHWEPLRALGAAWSPDDWTLAGRAVQLVEWVRTNRFCGRCGAATQREPDERAMRCPRCGLRAYPRLAPAVIVLVRKGDEALLAQGSRTGRRMYSTLAGFVEPGEGLEEAVRREVLEEVGLRLGEVRYFGSQPWPFPHSLMVAFTADWAGGDIAADGEEILDARWWRADALPPIPPSISIARRLIDDWLGAVGR